MIPPETCSFSDFVKSRTSASLNVVFSIRCFPVVKRLSENRHRYENAPEAVSQFMVNEKLIIVLDL